jgi:transposase
MKSRRRRRRISQEFKIAAVRQLESGKSVAEVARACQVDGSMLHRWRVAWEKDPANAFSGERAVSAASREAELERTIGRLTLENDFLKRALLKLELQRAGGSGSGGEGSTPTWKAKRGGEGA